MKSVRIRSFFGPYFLAFGLNRERSSVSLGIQSECRKIRTRKAPNRDTFHTLGVFTRSREYNGRVFYSHLLLFGSCSMRSLHLVQSLFVRLHQSIPSCISTLMMWHHLCTNQTVNGRGIQHICYTRVQYLHKSVGQWDHHAVFCNHLTILSSILPQVKVKIYVLPSKEVETLEKQYKTSYLSFISICPQRLFQVERMLIKLRSLRFYNSVVDYETL